jgi:hypothetical protein
MRTLTTILIATGMIALALTGCGGASTGVGMGAGGVGVGVGTGAVGPSASVGVGTSLSPLTPNQVHLEWRPEARGDRTRVTGYIYNDWILPARNIVLLVESVDANGQVVGRTGARVDRVLTPGSRSYFDVSIPTPAASYRVAVASLTWSPGDGSR